MSKFDSILTVLQNFKTYYITLKIENEINYTTSNNISLYKKRLDYIKSFFIKKNIDKSRIIIYDIQPSTQISEEQLLKLKEYKKGNISLENKPFNIVFIISK